MPSIIVRCFAGLQEAAGEQVEVEVPEGATAEDVKRAVAEKVPEAAGLIERAALAVNRRLARPGDEVEAGDEVALLPPVSGG